MSVEYFFREGGFDVHVGGVGAQRLVVLAVHAAMLDLVHAVMLDSGFVGLDTASGKIVERSDLPVSKVCTKHLCYTLPELLSSDVIDFVVLGCQTLGPFVNVYGCFGNVDSDSSLRRVCLNGGLFAAPIVIRKDDERVFDEMRKQVRDGLALPLITDLRHSWDCKQKHNKKRQREITVKHPLPDPILSDDSSTSSGSGCGCGCSPNVTDSSSVSSSSCSSGCSPDTTDSLTCPSPFFTFL